MIGKTLLQILRESKYTTVLSGYAMLEESGYPAIRDGEASYDIEQKYGYSADEMLSSSFYTARTEQFFSFYRNEILSALDKPPGKCFYEMAELERRGLFNCIITRRMFGLPETAGCKNVINLHGSVYVNYCPHCKRNYSVDYVRNSKRVPICLFGEMVDNQVITRAAQEVQKADVLLVLGTNLKTQLCRQLVQYYEGKRLILVKETPHFADRYADLVVNERVDDTLEKIIKEMGE